MCRRGSRDFSFIFAGFGQRAGLVAPDCRSASRIRDGHRDRALVQTHRSFEPADKIHQVFRRMYSHFRTKVVTHILQFFRSHKKVHKPGIR